MTTFKVGDRVVVTEATKARHPSSSLSVGFTGIVTRVDDDPDDGVGIGVEGAGSGGWLPSMFELQQRSTHNDLMDRAKVLREAEHIMAELKAKVRELDAVLALMDRAIVDEVANHE